MKRNKTNIRYKKERIVISDILPYEIPVTFSNRYFYDFLVSHNVVMDGNNIKWQNGDAVLGAVMKLLFGFHSNKEINGNALTVNKGEFRTEPFSYKISHKENDFRELTIIHPKNQLAVVQLYNKYKDIMLYYCSVSPFSIRKPHKVARFIYHKDKTHYKKLCKIQEHEIIEESHKEYENLKTFFTYKDYSNIHKFYESYKYHRCEKKFKKLFTFDISKCFDSIYTHSITWALLNKGIVKANLDGSGRVNETFGGEFDNLMQEMNYGETNGIIIGPEFSRIFAELILQQIDFNVLSYLKKSEPPLFHRRDYEIFRYVDDYFVFYNDERIKDSILTAYKLKLKEYKLYLSDLKSFSYEKPIITDITIGKAKISDLLNKYLSFNDKNHMDNNGDNAEDNMENGTVHGTV